MLPACTNQTGREISLPDFLPLTLSVISFALFNRCSRSTLTMEYWASSLGKGFRVILYLDVSDHHAHLFSTEADHKKKRHKLVALQPDGAPIPSEQLHVVMVLLAWKRHVIFRSVWPK